jgi:signal transduction histidine kinase
MTPAVVNLQDEAETSVVRVFLLDDTRELRQRVRRALTQSADLNVVGEADDPVDGLPLIVDLQPDIVVCDLSMPRMDGLEAIPHIARSAPDAGIVIFSGFLGEALGDTALSLGADRYVEKSAPLAELEETVRSVAADRRAGLRPEVKPLPADATTAVPRPAPARRREDRPIEDVVAEGRAISLRPVYLIGVASLLVATVLTVATELAPATFLLLWLAPTFVIGALAPAFAGWVAVVVSSALWAFCSHRLGNDTWYLSATGVLITQAALAYGANRVVNWMQRRVDRQKALTDDLRRSNAELEHFAYVASHDLAAPLRSVSSFTSVLAHRYEGRLDEEADRVIGFITAGTKRMQRMIDDLLAFARAGRVESEVGPFSLASVLDQVRTDLAAEIDERGAQVTSGPLPELVGDEPRILQVVQNLVANAIKFCPPGRTPVIQVSAARLRSGWRIDVRDNGIGVDPRYASKVFGMFQRLHGDDDFPGTGIGLAICQRIVERHGGHIWVDGFEGTGSTFSFTVPDDATP